MSSAHIVFINKLAQALLAPAACAAVAIAGPSALPRRPPCAGVRRARHRQHVNATAAMAATLLFMVSPDMAFAQDTSFGQRLFRDKADCQFCHGIDGDGRGAPQSPGRAANLHTTILNREQLIEVIACGRPGTEMPHFDKYAYEETNCYGLSAAQLGNDLPRDPHSTSLTKREIEAVVDYILATFVGSRR